MTSNTCECNNTNLAIGSMPIQSCKEVYTPNAALYEGTIFPELNLPFYVTDPLSATAKTSNCQTCEAAKSSKEYEKLFTDEHFDRETVMRALYEISFFLDDLTLYLDTHPDDFEAIAVFNQYHANRKKLLQRMEVDFSPLKRDCIVDAKGNKNHFSWIDGPLPWEGANV